METNKSTLELAAALQPIIAYLFKMGVIGVYGYTDGHIQLTEKKFREIWPDAQPDGYGCMEAKYNGITFTAWSQEATEKIAAEVLANG